MQFRGASEEQKTYIVVASRTMTPAGDYQKSTRPLLAADNPASNGFPFKKQVSLETRKHFQERLDCFFYGPFYCS